MSIHYREPEYDWSGHMMKILVEISARIDHLAAQRTYEQMEAEVIEAQHAVDLLERAPMEAMRQCAIAFEQWWDEYRIDYDREAAGKVRYWLAELKRTRDNAEPAADGVEGPC